MIGILTQNDDFHMGIRRAFQRIEDIVHLRINDAGGIFRLKKFPKAMIIFFIEFSGQKAVPVVSYFNHRLFFNLGGIQYKIPHIPVDGGSAPFVEYLVPHVLVEQKGDILVPCLF
jgi:hypothetical protein